MRIFIKFRQIVTRLLAAVKKQISSLSSAREKKPQAGQSAGPTPESVPALTPSSRQQSPASVRVVDSGEAPVQETEQKSDLLSHAPEEEGVPAKSQEDISATETGQIVVDDGEATASDPLQPVTVDDSEPVMDTAETPEIMDQVPPDEDQPVVDDGQAFRQEADIVAAMPPKEPQPAHVSDLDPGFEDLDEEPRAIDGEDYSEQLDEQLANGDLPPHDLVEGADLDELEQEAHKAVAPDVTAEEPGIEAPVRQAAPERSASRKPKKAEPWSPGRYYAYFILQRNDFFELTDDEVDAFLEKLAEDDIDDVLGWTIWKIENYLFESLKRIQLIGELPISQAAFEKLCQYNQEYPGRWGDGRLSRQKKIPPAFFMTMMVFCARYSEEDARNFWGPYSQLVWGYDEADLSFQNVSRDHFQACRMDIENTIGLKFFIYRLGDVVLPIYQHAIIPYHLMDHMAEWIVKNVDVFLKFDTQLLHVLISDQEALRYMPQQLQRFLTDEDTSQSAVRLIETMSDAIALFQETNAPDMVEKLIDSPIEKSLWNAIHNLLVAAEDRIEKLTIRHPKLDWVWMMDEEDFGLCLSGVQSPPSQKPDTLYVTSEGNFKTATYRPNLSPWEDKEKGWGLDFHVIPSDALIDKEAIFVVSNQFNLDNSPEEQQACVLYNQKIPVLDENCVFFRCGLNRKHARQKDSIDSAGDWIIISKTDFDLQSPDGDSIPYSGCNLPQFLRLLGFNHVRKYALELPIRMLCDETETLIQEQDGRLYLEPILRGNDPVADLSEAVPPVFQSKKVSLSFQPDPQYLFRKTFFSISSTRSGYTTASLAELRRSGLLTESETGIEIALDSFLDTFGQYQIDVISGLRSLLDEPIVFGYMPDMIISPRNLETIFSPKNPFTVEVSGSSIQTIDLPEDAKLFPTDDGLVVQWKLHKQPECAFSINDNHGGHIKLMWEINRVTAWVDGGFNKNLIAAGQESKAGLNVRGKPFEEFTWIINNDDRSPDKLDIKGEYSKPLQETQIRDFLKETKKTVSSVKVEIADMRWQVFQYMKKPTVRIQEIKYKDRSLDCKLKLSADLIGQYQLQVKKKGTMAAPVAVRNLEALKEALSWKVELSQGDYVLEIHLDNELLALSEKFSYKKSLYTTRIDEKNILPEAPQISVDEISAKSYFDILTADKSQLQAYERDGYSVIPAVQQLLSVSDHSYWYTDGKVEEGIKNLLPYWAVTKHPFRFVERKFHKSLIIYPAETALGGIVGKGHTHLKVDKKRVNVYAAWKPAPDGEYVKLFLCFPDMDVDQRFFKLSKVTNWKLDHLRPAYQCVDCGDLLGSGAGGFPPSIFSQHLHGKQGKAHEQFIDTRHKESLDNTLSMKEDETLDFSNSVKKSITHNYLQLLIKDPKLKRYGELSKPIVSTNNLDFSKAFTELYDNSKDDKKADAINRHFENVQIHDALEQHLSALSGKIVAISAMMRLAENLSAEDSLSEIQRHTLILGMVLRMRANLPHEFDHLLKAAEVEESALIQITQAAREGFPKLLEWAIAWSEIFFVHAIS